MYRDGAARKVLGDRDFVFGDELTRENLLKIVVTADELREVNVYKVCVQPLDGSEFTVHVDVAACRISDLKSQIRAKNGIAATMKPAARSADTRGGTTSPACSLTPSRRRCGGSPSLWLPLAEPAPRARTRRWP